MWLSLVERSVRDREVVGSNPAIPTIRTQRQADPGLPFPFRRELPLLADLLHWMGYGLCHQLPERSFFGGGTQLPVCVRDTGIYLGVPLSLIWIAILHRRSHPRGFPSPLGWVAIAAMVGVMAIDGVTEYVGLRPTTNEIRLMTGLLCGYAIGAVLEPMLADEVWLRGSPERVLDPPWRLGVWLLSAFLAYPLIWWGAPFLGVAYPILVAAAIVATLMAVNLVIVCFVPAFERKAERLWDAWPALLLAFGLSWFEIWLAHAVRDGLVHLASRL
jgi:uncharacterized membrane protein